MARDTRRRSGFTIIEVLIVVAIIGVVAALLIPNLLDAMQKAKQKRTVSDLRAVGTAWFAWLTDQASAAAAGAGQTQVDWGDLSVPLTAEELLDLLYADNGPAYVIFVPSRDGWGTPYEYAWAADINATPVLGLRSLGRDGQEGPTPNPYPMGPFNSTNYDEDMVWVDGNFIRYPSGQLSN